MCISLFTNDLSQRPPTNNIATNFLDHLVLNHMRIFREYANLEK